MIRFAVLGGEASHEVVDQERDVLAPLAQRRQAQLDDVQPVVRGPGGRRRCSTSASRSRLVAATTRTSTSFSVDAARPA